MKIDTNNVLTYLNRHNVINLDKSIIFNQCKVINFGQGDFAVISFKKNIFVRQNVIDTDLFSLGFNNEVLTYQELLNNHVPACPKLLFFDDTNKVLCTEFMDNYQSLGSNMNDVNSISVSNLVKTISVFHDSNIQSNNKSLPDSFNFFLNQSICDMDDLIYKNITSQVRKNSELMDSIQQLALEYTNNCFMHGNLTLKNLLIPREPTCGGSCFLTNFQKSGNGDINYDLGSLLASFLFSYGFDRLVKRQKKQGKTSLTFLQNLILSFSKKPNVKLDKIIRCAGINLLVSYLDNLSTNSTDVKKILTFMNRSIELVAKPSIFENKYLLRN